ncbi:MAG: flagellar basal body P-ring protein FlgI [Phycisphaerae bacterium]
MTQTRQSRTMLAALAAALATLVSASADLRVQDVAKLQGQRGNRIFGFGLVVGLNNSGDGAKSPATLRALMSLHGAYHQPILDLQELKANNSVAIVAVDVTIPEFGAREGQALDVVVSAVGPAKSIVGGQLLTTPLQESTLSIADVLALAGGRVEQIDASNPKRGVIRGGCTLERDFFYNFLDDDSIWLVIDDAKAGYPWSQVVARAINHELSSPVQVVQDESASGKRVKAQATFAEAVGPKNVRVRIPSYELQSPAGFISRVLQTRLFATPEQEARVVINRTNKSVSFTGSVTISPTVLQIPGLGTVSVGGGSGGAAGGVAGAVGLDTQQVGGVPFQDLLTTLGKLQLSADQLVAAVEHLHRTGTLNAQLIYAE